MLANSFGHGEGKNGGKEVKERGVRYEKGEARWRERRDGKGITGEGKGITGGGKGITGGGKED